MTLALTFRHSVSVDAAAAEVYAYLADPTTASEWHPDATDAVRCSGDGGVGSRYRCQVRFLGRRRRLEYTLTELEPVSRIEWDGHGRSLHAHDTIRVCEVVPGTTMVRHETAISFPWPMPLALLLAFPLRRHCDQARRGLQRTLRHRFRQAR